MTDSFQQSAVSAAIWRWPAAAPGGRGGPLKTRVRAAMQAAVGGAAGLLLLLVFRHRAAGLVVLAIAAVLLVAGLFVPRAFAAIERFGKMLGRSVGAGLTWLLLVPFFYLCFVPARTLMALLKKDPLKLRFSPEAGSYWTPRPPVSAEQVRKQY